VTLSDGRRKTVFIAILVLRAFVGPKPKGMQCCHLDGNRTNDSLRNLIWGSKATNEAHKALHGTVTKGQKNGMAKLTNEAVREIRRVGYPLEQHVLKYGVTKSLVSAVILGRIWKHVR
jgi:hypothetical protein